MEVMTYILIAGYMQYYKPVIQTYVFVTNSLNFTKRCLGWFWPVKATQCNDEVLTNPKSESA